MYPTSGDFCDWHYGVHGSYCYTSEIGTAFHQHPDDIDHIAVRNLGLGFYIAEIADNPRERGDLGIANISKNQYVQLPNDVDIPPLGNIPIDMCVASGFAYSLILQYLMSCTEQSTEPCLKRLWTTRMNDNGLGDGYGI